MSNEPNLNFGSPTIFFDSHPEEQESYLYSYWSSLKSNLKIAFTGEVPKFHSPGKLRIIWWTHDGNQGLKDYELHEYEQVRANFDILLNMPEIRRVVIQGYSGQNPYVLVNGTNPWQEKFRRMEREARRAKALQKKAEGKGGQDAIFDDFIGGPKIEKGKSGTLVDIDDVIEQNDRAEEERRRVDADKIWKENEGLLSGEMV
ncbi:hypothetical protein F5882DRAFT_24058 [Hyaloscypha sp. PMI_1271]|nr:hypothetical protein F5882DRAFT_24058 [Hyaloscypha sp. PMI_1271]